MGDFLSKPHFFNPLQLQAYSSKKLNITRNVRQKGAINIEKALNSLCFEIGNADFSPLENSPSTSF